MYLVRIFATSNLLGYLGYISNSTPMYVRIVP